MLTKAQSPQGYHSNHTSSRLRTKPTRTHQGPYVYSIASASKQRSIEVVVIVFPLLDIGWTAAVLSTPKCCADERKASSMDKDEAVKDGLMASFLL